MSGKKVQWMKRVVEFLKKYPAARAPFFWLTFFNLRLLKPVEYLVLRELMDCDSALDLGCGRHSMVAIVSSKTRTVGVEFFKPHYEEAVASGRHTEYIHADITKVDFPAKSFDAVVLLDVLEHLPKEEGLSLLKKMEGWARRKVVIFTPNGFLPQDEFDENPLMAHQSGWDAAEMKAQGYRVYGVRGFKAFKHGDNHEHQDSIADVAQAITYHWPEKAFQIFCVKTLPQA